MDCACEMLNYIFGLNPLGISYVTGLGDYQVQNPHDRESAYTKEKGWGAIPGKTIFGPGVIQGAGGPSTFPALASLPVERKFGDDRNSISTAEFTIFETESHNALFTVISNGGTWDESNDPFAKQQNIGIRNVNRNSLSNPGGLSAQAILGKNSLTMKFTLKAAGSIKGALFSMNGTRLMSFSGGSLSAGTHAITLPAGKFGMGLLAGGMFFCKLSVDNYSEILAIVR